jgi:hypothetical protein
MSIELVVLNVAGTTIRDDDGVNRCLRDALAAGGVSVTAAEANAVISEHWRDQRHPHARAIGPLPPHLFDQEPPRASCSHPQPS